MNDIKKQHQGLGMLWADAAGLEELASHRPLTIKMGFDPTAADLHLGHAVGLWALRRLQDAGHRVALVVGDFTAAIGDPTGRDATRPAADALAIQANARTYAEQALRILDPAKTQTLFNGKWLEALGAAGMVRLASKTTLAQMLAREDFATRHGAQAPIGVHELLYPLLQAHDSVVIEPDAELGGTDQRFNLLMGRELMREAGQKPQACLMVGLLVGLDGRRKMSKSLGNHMGLTESPEAMFAKTMSISDESMEQWIQTLDISIEDSLPMERKKSLGQWIVSRLHEPEAALRARSSWEASRQRDDWSDAPTLRVELGAEGALWSSLLRDWGWEESAAKARDRIAQGALRLDGAKITDPKAKAPPGVQGLLRYGSKKAARLETAPSIAPAKPKL